MHRSLTSVGLALALSSAAADETCLVRPTLSCVIPNDFVHYTQDCPEEGLSSEGFVFKCLPAPPPAQLSCQSSGGMVECEAWPQSPQLTYRYIYTVLNGVEPNYTASEFSPNLVGQCSGNSGRVAVTVIAPNGTTSNTQTVFACLHDE